jgi:hypothetical protein
MPPDPGAMKTDCIRSHEERMRTHDEASRGAPSKPNARGHTPSLTIFQLCLALRAGRQENAEARTQPVAGRCLQRMRPQSLRKNLGLSLLSNHSLGLVLRLNPGMAGPLTCGLVSFRNSRESLQEPQGSKRNGETLPLVTTLDIMKTPRLPWTRNY